MLKTKNKRIADIKLESANFMNAVNFGEANTPAVLISTMGVLSNRNIIMIAPRAGTIVEISVEDNLPEVTEEVEAKLNKLKEPKPLAPKVEAKPSEGCCNIM